MAVSLSWPLRDSIIWFENVLLNVLGRLSFRANLLPNNQGCNEIRCHPGQEASLAPSFSNMSFFGSKCTVLKKVLVTLLGLCDAPAVIRRPGNCAPLAHLRYTSDSHSAKHSSHHFYLKLKNEDIHFNVTYRMDSVKLVKSMKSRESNLKWYTLFFLTKSGFPFSQ